MFLDGFAHASIKCGIKTWQNSGYKTESEEFLNPNQLYRVTYNSKPYLAAPLVAGEAPPGLEFVYSNSRANIIRREECFTDPSINLSYYVFEYPELGPLSHLSHCSNDFFTEREVGYIMGQIMDIFEYLLDSGIQLSTGDSGLAEYAMQLRSLNSFYVARNTFTRLPLLKFVNFLSISRFEKSLDRKQINYSDLKYTLLALFERNLDFSEPASDLLMEVINTIRSYEPGVDLFSKLRALPFFSRVSGTGPSSKSFCSINDIDAIKSRLKRRCSVHPTEKDFPFREKSSDIRRFEGLGYTINVELNSTSHMIKAFKTYDEHYRLFGIFKEIVLQKKINHPNILKYLDCFVDDNVSVVKVLLEARELETPHCMLSANVNLTQSVVFELESQYLEALRHLHQNRLLHRSLEPGTLLVQACASEPERKGKLTNLALAQPHSLDLRSDLAAFAGVFGKIFPTSHSFSLLPDMNAINSADDLLSGIRAKLEELSKSGNIPIVTGEKLSGKSFFLRNIVLICMLCVIALACIGGIVYFFWARRREYSYDW